VGVVSLVYGSLITLCGLAFMLFFTAFASFFGAAVQEASKNNTPEQAKAVEAAGGMMGILAGAGAIIGICFIGIAVLFILGGIGVLKRQQWGRILTLVLGGITGLLALLSLFSIARNPGQTLLALILYGGYTALTYVVLLNTENAAEFS
jgi:hypothetical protein